MIRPSARRAALVALVALAGCGGSDEQPREASGPARTDDPRALYEQAVMGLDDVGSGTLDADLEFRLSLGATQKTFSLSEEGAFSGLRGTALPDYGLELTLSEFPGGDQRLEVVHLGETLFLKPAGADAFQRQTGELVERTAQVYAQEIAALPPGRLPMLSLTPADWVEDDLRFD
ncbi:MAG TPA: hypothetical protein VGW11_01235, partial [Solirubrobacteraceae bacterium]|nr:hypothetical protein [Solirubrobacteraceae bacterium]